MTNVQWVLKFEFWPDEDKRAWSRALESKDLFSDERDLGALSEGTVRLYRQGYGHWLSFIKRQFPEMMEFDPLARVTRETVRAFVEEGKERGLKPRTVSTHLTALLKVLYWLGHTVPKWLRAAERRVYAASDPHALKKPLPFEATDLFERAMKEMALVEADTKRKMRTRATRFRQWLMLALQIACPVRRRAMVAMTVSFHVLVHAEGIQLRFRREDMKDRRDREMPLHDRLVAPFKKYLEVYRPALLPYGSNTDALWISANGRPFSEDSYTCGLAVFTKRELGITLRPHAFRHIAATSIATRDAANAYIIKDVLGHSTIRTSEMYYNRATTREACASYSDLISNIYRTAKRNGRPKAELLPPPSRPRRHRKDR